MSTTIPSRTAAERAAGTPVRGHLRLVPEGESVAAARARARAAHPAGRGLAAVPAAPAGSHAARPAPLRLTRRGRAVLRGLVVLLMLVVMTAAGLALARGARAADGPAPAVVVHTHVVLPGETLWGIARQVAPHDDPRDTVARLVEFNSLPSTAVHAGQQLSLPPGLPTR